MKEGLLYTEMLNVSESTGDAQCCGLHVCAGFLPLTSVISIEGESECNRYK